MAVRAPLVYTGKRYNTPGDAHALTFSCFRRQEFLSKDRSRRWLVEAIDRARDKLHFHVWAYVVMPEHAHLLVWPTDKVYDVSDILNSIKQSVSKRALIYVRRHARDFLPRMEDRQPNGEVHYRFWQRGGGYDRNRFEPVAVFEQIAYMHNNQVRRGLCAKPEAWLWSSAADYAGVRVGPLRLDRESLPVNRKFLMREYIPCPRKAVGMASGVFPVAICSATRTRCWRCLEAIGAPADVEQQALHFIHGADAQAR